MILGEWEAKFIEGIRQDGEYYNHKEIFLGNVESVDFLRIESDGCIFIESHMIMARGIRENLKVGDSVMIYEYIPKELYILLGVLEGNTTSSTALEEVDRVAADIGSSITEMQDNLEKLNKSKKELEDSVAGLQIQIDDLTEKLNTLLPPTEEGSGD